MRAVHALFLWIHPQRLARSLCLHALAREHHAADPEAYGALELFENSSLGKNTFTM